MVRPCKECEFEFQPKKCGTCTQWNAWFPEAWDLAREWILRELAWSEAKPKSSPDGKYTYREIVFGAVFTELWR